MYSENKGKLVRALVSIFESTRQYAQHEVDRLIRATIRAEILEEPGYSADHLRLALIEAGYLKRSKDGMQYWLADDLSGEDDKVAGERETILAYVIDHKTETEIECPICGAPFAPKQMLRHYEKHHLISTISYKHWPRKLTAIWPYL